MMRLNQELDWAGLGGAFAREGRVQIRDFLAPESARRLQLHLEKSGDWRIHVNQQKGDKIFELFPQVLAELGEEQARKFDEAVFLQARWGFQFRFQAIRIDRSGDPDSPLTQFLALMCSEELIGRLRFVTGDSAIEFADAQATSFGPGDFLSGHDDSNPGQARIAAYVMNLTRVWRTAWGGILQFHDADGNIQHGWTPSFNVLNLFSVPCPHSVSFVAPFAVHRRYSVTGWLRGRGE